MCHLITEYAWKFALKSYTIVILTSCHLWMMTAGNPTESEPVVGNHSGDQITSKVVTDPTAYSRYGTSDPDTNPMLEFTADIRTRWECMILLTVMTIVCVSGCVDALLGSDLLFHPLPLTPIMTWNVVELIQLGGSGGSRYIIKGSRTVGFKYAWLHTRSIRPIHRRVVWLPPSCSVRYTHTYIHT